MEPTTYLSLEGDELLTALLHGSLLRVVGLGALEELEAGLRRLHVFHADVDPLGDDAMTKGKQELIHGSHTFCVQLWT